ncbi:MAG: hypothetical protein ACPG1C_07855 [Alphaproteobacteria bacterium]
MIRPLLVTLMLALCCNAAQAGRNNHRAALSKVSYEFPAGVDKEKHVSETATIEFLTIAEAQESMAAVKVTHPQIRAISIKIGAATFELLPACFNGLKLPIYDVSLRGHDDFYAFTVHTASEKNGYSGEVLSFYFSTDARPALKRCNRTLQ